MAVLKKFRPRWWSNSRGQKPLTVPTLALVPPTNAQYDLRPLTLGQIDECWQLDQRCFLDGEAYSRDYNEVKRLGDARVRGAVSALAREWIERLREDVAEELEDGQVRYLSTSHPDRAAFLGDPANVELPLVYGGDRHDRRARALAGGVEARAATTRQNRRRASHRQP